ncbi:hypothetical protein GCM10027589_00410 [Actinocorallia lasiicapitis]
MTETERVLARALMEIIISIDLSDDEDIDSDVAAALLEPIAALLQAAHAGDRSRIVALFTELAQAESATDRRMTALDLPGALGLIG